MTQNDYRSVSKVYCNYVLNQTTISPAII